MDDPTGRQVEREIPPPGALPPVVRMSVEGRDGLLVVLSDLHIGGDPGQEDFFCHAELMSLLDDLDREPGPVTLLINGDFFEFLQVTVPPGENRAQAIVEHPDHAELFAHLRRWNARPGHRTSYVVGNHDSETGWNADIGAYLIAEGIVHDVALGYEHRFAAGAARTDRLRGARQRGGQPERDRGLRSSAHRAGGHVRRDTTGQPDRAAWPLRRAG